MKKIIQNAFLVMLFVLAVGFLVACGEKEQPKLNVVSEINVALNEEKKLTATVEFSEEVVIKFASSDTSIATVDANGNIKGVNIGTTNIRVSIEGFDVTADVKVTVKPLELTLIGPNEVEIGKTVKFEASDEKGGSDVLWSSEDSKIATVDGNGNVKGVSEGTVNIIIVSSISGEVKMKEIKVTRPEVESIDINKVSTGKVYLLDEVKLQAIIQPTGAVSDVTWISSDEEIATVDENGLVKTHRSGEVEIIATSVENPEVSGKYTLVIEVDPIELLKKFHIENPIHTHAKSNLIPDIDDEIIGSVNYYWFGDLNLSQRILAIDTNLLNPTETNPYVGQVATPEIVEAVELRSRRPGVLKPEIKYITYHDTGNYNAGATAVMHANYIPNSERYRSWHYTVDETEVIQHLPDNEIAFHGDSYDAYVYSIGVETAINKGSDFFTTWHRTAKLMAGLLYEYNLTVDAVEQHHDWNGKDCPQVLRATGLWETALKMIEAELLVLQELQDYTIEFMSNSPEYLSNTGRVLKLDTQERIVEYAIRAYNDSGYDRTLLLRSVLPAAGN